MRIPPSGPQQGAGSYRQYRPSQVAGPNIGAVAGWLLDAAVLRLAAPGTGKGALQASAGALASHGGFAPNPLRWRSIPARAIAARWQARPAPPVASAPSRWLHRQPPQFPFTGNTHRLLAAGDGLSGDLGGPARPWHAVTGGNVSLYMRNRRRPIWRAPADSQPRQSVVGMGVWFTNLHPGDGPGWKQAGDHDPGCSGAAHGKTGPAQTRPSKPPEDRLGLAGKQLLECGIPWTGLTRPPPRTNLGPGVPAVQPSACAKRSARACWPPAHDLSDGGLGV